MKSRLDVLQSHRPSCHLSASVLVKSPTTSQEPEISLFCLTKKMMDIWVPCKRWRVSLQVNSFTFCIFSWLLTVTSSSFILLAWKHGLSSNFKQQFVFFFFKFCHDFNNWLGFLFLLHTQCFPQWTPWLLLIKLLSLL